MEIKLTQYSKASGCGCKIAPAVLENILKGTKSSEIFSQLLVGNESKDDAAVYELDNGNCIISTTDFFTPIVDDPFDFGQIAATNAISDVYAMGGKPIMAIAILGWPVDKISPEHAAEVIKGAQKICSAAGIPLAGGHSVDTQEPIFGLAVTGTVLKENLKRNNSIRENDVLYITKPLGIGIMSTALKRGLLKQDEYEILLKETTTLNGIGEKLGGLTFVHAITDVTGFGLAGHLLEMIGENSFTARIKRLEVPVAEPAKIYAKQFVFPDNTTRNYSAQSVFMEGLEDLDMLYFCDPQTSGGLLIAIDPMHENEIEQLFHSTKQFYKKIGFIGSGKEKKIIFE